MSYKVNFTPEFRVWWNEQEERLREIIAKKVADLEEKGPHLGRPQADTLEGSKLSNLKELRVLYKGDPYRILYAFDPKREAALLVGGNKAGDKKWYKKMIPQAEAVFATHLERLKEKHNYDNTN